MLRLLCLLLLAGTVVHADDCPDTITVKGGYLFGYKYSQNCSEFEKTTTLMGVEYRLKKLLKTNDESYSQVQQAETCLILGKMFGFCGGLLLGFGAAVTGPSQREVDLSQMLIIASLPTIALSFTLDYSGTRKLLKGIRKYNSGLHAAP